MSDAEIGSYFHLSPEVIDIINLHNPSMFNAALKDSQTVEYEADERSTITKLDAGARFVTESGSRACVNPGVSAPIVSPPIVSTPASAEAYRNRDTSDTYRNQDVSDTVTITISRETAESVVKDLPEASPEFAFGRIALACRAALEGER